MSLISFLPSAAPLPQRQREMLLEFQEAKRLKEQAKRKEEAGEILLGGAPANTAAGTAPADPGSVMAGWLAEDASSSGGSAVRQGTSAAAGDIAPNESWRSKGAAPARVAAAGKASVSELDELMSGAPPRASRTWNAVEYLHRGQLAPLEVWTRLVDTAGEPASFPKFAARQPVVVAVTHFRQDSALLRAGVLELNQRLPRRFPAEVVLVTRDGLAQNKRLAKKAVRPVTVLGPPDAPASASASYSLDSRDQESPWMQAYGVTQLLVDWGLAVFIIDSGTGELISVNYNCQPTMLPEYIQEAVQRRRQQSGSA